jgi:protein required for attachment to host cells
MSATLIVTANASRARFFSHAHRSDRLEEINDMVNEAVRLRASETESDSLGPKSAGKSIHNVGGATPNNTYEPHQTPVEHQAELFARSVAAYLLQEYQANRFNEMALFASPQFLGILRKLLDHGVAGTITLEVNKDYTQLSHQQLLEQIHALQEKV